MSSGRQSQGHLNKRRETPPDFFDWKGHSASTNPSSDTTIAFQNVRGLNTYHMPLDISIGELFTAMDHHNISILGISEHHLAMANHIQREKVSAITQFQLNSSSEYSKQGRLMGGTGILATPPIAGRMSPDGKCGNEMGRWSIIHLRRHLQSPLSIISIYQVCQSPTNTIGHTAWHQQRRHLDLQMRPEHPRTAFIEDLTKCIQQLQQKKHAIIIGGDWNDWLGSPNSALLKMSSHLQLIDPWPLHHPQQRNSSTLPHMNTVNIASTPYLSAQSYFMPLNLFDTLLGGFSAPQITEPY